MRGPKKTLFIRRAYATLPLGGLRLCCWITGWLTGALSSSLMCCTCVGVERSHKSCMLPWGIYPPSHCPGQLCHKACLKVDLNLRPICLFWNITEIFIANVVLHMLFKIMSSICTVTIFFPAFNSSASLVLMPVIYENTVVQYLSVRSMTWPKSHADLHHVQLLNPGSHVMWKSSTRVHRENCLPSWVHKTAMKQRPLHTPGAGLCSSQCISHKTTEQWELVGRGCFAPVGMDAVAVTPHGRSAPGQLLLTKAICANLIYHVCEEGWVSSSAARTWSCTCMIARLSVLNLSEIFHSLLRFF